ncbi:thioredoxin [Fusarium mexicanum]|uniref:Thioredoxin n=1 Tax=Fusarium mexicanum TaxID=751941 RepID=A0A8H5IRA8_9HYPO|nr:thioredoxin [Fusarium mexicanum]
MVVHEIHSEEEFKEALENHSVVFVEFLSTWSSPCHVIRPIVDRFSNTVENEHVFFCSVDADKLSEVYEDQGVRYPPTFVVFEDGVKKHEVVGGNSQAIHAMLQKLVKKDSEI